MADTPHTTASPAVVSPAAGATRPIDTDALAAWLASQLPGFSGPIRLEAFEGGQSNPTYKLSSAQGTYVLRTKPGPVAQLLPSAHAIEREYVLMRGLAGTAVPVPRMDCLCEDESIIGRAFYLMEYLPGRVLWDPVLPGMQAPQRRAIYDEMNRVIAALHTVDVARQGLQSYGKPGNYFERQIGRWSRQYVASITQPIPAMDALMDWLPRNIPDMARDPAMVRIVHGDFRLDNLMFDASEDTVIAVLDWELSTLGHPLADFSYHCMAWHIPPGIFRGMGGLDLSGLGIPREADYMGQYCERTGLASPRELAQDWNFYMAYNLFRIAAILQGIAKRAETGTASSAQAATQGAGARPLAELAWSYASRK